MAEAATPLATEDQTYGEAPPLPRYPTGIRDSIPQTDSSDPNTPVDPSTGPPKFPSFTDVDINKTSAVGQGQTGKLGSIREGREGVGADTTFGEYQQVEEVGEDGETEAARALRLEAEREKKEAAEIHELIRKNTVPVGTGEKLAHEAGEKEWTRDDQVELARLLREDSDEYIPKDSDDSWITRTRQSQSSVVTGVTRMSSEPRLVSRKEMQQGGLAGDVQGETTTGIPVTSATVVQTSTMATAEGSATRVMEETTTTAPGIVSTTVDERTITTMVSPEQEGVSASEPVPAIEGGAVVNGEREYPSETGAMMEGVPRESVVTETTTTEAFPREEETLDRDSRDMGKVAAAGGLGAVAGAATGAAASGYLGDDEFKTTERKPSTYLDDEAFNQEEMRTPTKGALVLKDEVEPRSYTSTYTDYHSKMGAKVDITHDYGLSGGHASGVEDVIFLDMDTLLTAGSDGKVCIWDLNERYVKTEFEPYDDGEPISMIQLMPSGTGSKGINFLTLSKNTRIMRIWNIVGDSAILLRSMQIPASKNDLVMSLPVFSPSTEVYT